ncbi:Fic family protein [Candidatus Desantisbacteria bacterium]|nr:Fic family protein [Candidatus Desantisbacteria bacterium]
MKNSTVPFNPLYSITPNLLDSIKRISAQIALLNTRRFPKIIMAEFERHAREISAFSSTSIEGNPLPLTEVRRILKNLPHNITNSQKEVANYNDALVMLNRQLTTHQNLSLNLPLILEIHKIIMKDLLIKSKCGILRKEPVFVNDPRLQKTIYWPPDHEDVLNLMDELTGYIKQNVSKLDPIILAGIFHKQFVVIHPFIDGNGRTVRLLVKVLLAGMGLDTFNLFSFENYYNRNVTRYFQNVGVKGNYYDIANTLDFTAWLEYFAEGILDELYRISKELDIAVIEPSTELKEYHKAMLAYIDKKGFITDREYTLVTSRARPTRALDFNKMITLGYIERLGKGKATYYKLKKDKG